ncbi:MAG: ectoine/hydroxyectoine ABC transporter permease subunit EhuD [Castellaniella sp.]
MLDWKIDFTREIFPQLVHATGNTVLAAGGGYAVAVVLGLVFALAQRTPSRIVTIIMRELVEFIRSTPLLLQIFFIFYVGPQFGLRLSPWTAGLIAIGLHYASYLSEVYRGGIENVPQGQWEAARAINLSTTKTYYRIIIPQALPPALAGMGNYLVGIFKDTPMLSVIGVAELMHTANSVGATSYRYLEPYTMVGLIFLAISLPTAWLIRRFEKRLRQHMGLTR